MVSNSCLLLAECTYRIKLYIYLVYFAFTLSISTSRQNYSLPFSCSTLSAVASPTESCKDDNVYIVQKALQG